MHSLIKRLLVDMNLYPPFNIPYHNNEVSNGSNVTEGEEEVEKIDYISNIKKKSSLLLSQGLSRVGVISTTTAPTKSIKQD